MATSLSRWVDAVQGRRGQSRFSISGLLGTPALCQDGKQPQGGWGGAQLEVSRSPGGPEAMICRRHFGALGDTVGPGKLAGKSRACRQKPGTGEWCPFLLEDVGLITVARSQPGTGQMLRHKPKASLVLRTSWLVIALQSLGGCSPVIRPSGRMCSSSIIISVPTPYASG